MGHLRAFALFHLAILLQFGEFLLGFVELLGEVGVGMQTGYDSRACYTPGIDIALEVIAAYDA